MEEVDSIVEENALKGYEVMKKLHDDGGSADPELLWRLAKVCHTISAGLDKKNADKKKYILEGRDFAQAADKLSPNNFPILKWAAVLTGSSTDYVGIKEKMEQGDLFKSFLDQALAIDEKEFTLLHMRGRYAFSVANLSWIERKMCAVLFSAPPVATIDEALADFLALHLIKADEVRAKWTENLLYIAKCYIVKKDYKSAMKYLNEVRELEPADDGERAILNEVKDLIKKYGP